MPGKQSYATKNLELFTSFRTYYILRSMGPIEQFAIKPIFMLGGIPFTNAALAMGLSCVMTFYIFYVLPRTSDYFAHLNEMYYDFINNLCESTIGEGGKPFIPFVSAIFLFLLFGNIIGLIPEFFTFTSHLSMDIFLSGMVVFGVLLLAIVRNGINFVKLFAHDGVPGYILPLVVPIEIVSFLIRIFSLAIRLCINMCVGHITLKILLILATQFGPAGPVIGLIYIPFYTLEIGIAFLQAYIFTILTCVYLKDVVNLGHH